MSHLLVSWRIVVVCRRSLVVLEIVVVRSLLLLLEIVVGWSLLLLLRLVVIVVIVSRVGRGRIVVAVVSPTTTVVASPSSPASTAWTQPKQSGYCYFARVFKPLNAKLQVFLLLFSNVKVSK